jgi:hypothetical protein
VIPRRRVQAPAGSTKRALVVAEGTGVGDRDASEGGVRRVEQDVPLTGDDGGGDAEREGALGLCPLGAEGAGKVRMPVTALRKATGEVSPASPRYMGTLYRRIADTDGELPEFHPD